MLSCQKDKFSIPEGVHFLNCAYMSPQLKKVEEAGIEALMLKNDPSNIKTNDFFENSNKIRVEFSKIINNNAPEQIALIPSVSYGIANVVNNIAFSSDDEIILLGEQFPSNVYSWIEKARVTGAQIITVLPPENVIDRGKIWNERILEAIGPKTKVVAMCQAHWTDGTLFDLKSISSGIHEKDGYLIVDGTQSVGAYPFNVNEIKPDALICAGYKWLMGPYSQGVAYFSERFNRGKPIEHSWISRMNSKNFAGLVNYEEHYEAGAIRYDYGERSNFILNAMFLTALQQINVWGVDNIQEYCKWIIEPAVKSLSSLGYTIESVEYRTGHLFGIRLDKDLDLKKVATLLNKNNIQVSVRGSAVRVSPHLYNTHEDMEVLVRCLAKL
ncbi:MAG: aminotransferase class V-fold PLP-dependent enzyme [Bacteroidetes bacterium]|nr:aminotransferase class V-fold PLP-dependent enzyme [Bacteroidota bacterium]